MTTETNVYHIEQVNKLAQKERHMKVFTPWFVFKKWILKLLGFMRIPVNYIRSLGLFDFNILPIAPHKRLMSQISIFAGVLFILSGISPISSFSTVSMSYASDYIDTYSLPGDVLIADTDGYLMKINPQTGNASRIGMTDFAIHSVEGGQTLSQIAVRYDLSVETIMWENNIGNANMVVSGQKLVIPPIDGVSYTTMEGDSLEKLAGKYTIDTSGIIAQNNLTTDTLAIGQHLFLPGAKPLGPGKPTVVAGSGSTTSVGSSTVSLSNSNDIPIGTKPFIYPTRGDITQGYRAGHYAIDIADSSMPPVWSAGAGQVTKASSGGWGGGYGNHVIVSHGNGLETLYAHLDHLTVSEGQWVEQGQVLGQMGNTGRVYGATGIHLHWEVIKNGIKQYPGNYY
jgi:murein DD-endopeptidase MepM/ murein hydrolase activator NlpD